MICKQAQENFIPYLYQELDKNAEQALLEHIDRCRDCQKQLSDMTMVGNIISSSNPERWRKIQHQAFFSWKPIAWAAAFLIAFISGMISHAWLFSPGKSKAEEMIKIFAQNQRYRSSLTEDQERLIHAMEKEMAFFSGLSRQIDYVHNIENLLHKGKWQEALNQREEFFILYPKSPLHLPLSANLAYSLSKKGEYRKAIDIYQILLDQNLSYPEERGKYLWQMSLCMEKAGEKEKYLASLEKLEKNPIYEPYRKKAIRLLAENDFSECRFTLARTRYQKYLEEEGEKNLEIETYIKWINYHEKDYFYPLMLFVQAKQKGIEHYYGLKIILEQYPESPLAITACKMYLQSHPLQEEGEVIAFPENKTMDALLSYLNIVSQAYEFQEIAIFINYWRASLLEKKGMQHVALDMYKKIQEDYPYSHIGEIATQAILRIEQKSKKQRSDL